MLLITDHLIAVNKPSGLATQAPSGIDSIEVRVKRFLAQRKDHRAGGLARTYLGVPHRLDRPASGAMVFALDKKAARRLAEQFQRRQVKKTYWALVSGRGLPKQGTWTDWMRKIPDEARSEICEPEDPGAQSAVLHFRVLESTDQQTMLEINLETGRTHQIRLQSANRGYPILGDSLYGSSEWFGPLVHDARRRGIALHARELVICDPGTGKALTLVAPVPDSWPNQNRW